MKLTNKQIIILVSVVVVILLIAFYVTYKAGGKQDKPSTVNIGSDEAGTTALSQEEVDKLKALAINLHDDMKGLNWNWETGLYNKVSLLSNTELVALSNIFNVLYEAESEQTFLQWLRNEGFYWNDYTLQTNVNTITRRLVEQGVS